MIIILIILINFLLCNSFYHDNINSKSFSKIPSIEKLNLECILFNFPLFQRLLNDKREAKLKLEFAL